MAAAKSKRSNKSKKTTAKKGAAKRKSATSRQKDRFVSSATMGIILFALGFLFVFCLVTTSNASAIVFVRNFLSGSFGKLRYFASLLLCFLGLQTMFGDRWPLRRSVPVLLALLIFCVGTLLQVFRMDDLLRSLSSQGYRQNYNGFLWKSYEVSKNVPVGGGFMGGILGYPMGKYLDVAGSVLVLFFAIGGLVIGLIQMVTPMAGARISDWWADFLDDRAERQELREAERAERARQEEALLIPLPEELLEPEEEAPKPRTRVATGRKVKSTPPKAQPASPEKPVKATESKQTAAAQSLPKAKPMEEPKPVTKSQTAPAMQTAVGENRPALFIEDILPAHSATEDAYTEQDVERYKYNTRPSRKNPNAIPDFIAKRRAQYDAAYGAFGETEVEQETRGELSESVYENVSIQQEELPLDEVPWEHIEVEYTPESVQAQPTRRRTRLENPLDFQPQPDPKTRLDRPDWKPEEPETVETASPIEDYRQPPFSLLMRDEKHGRADTREQDAIGAQKLEETLASFGVAANVIKVVHGPAITRYEMAPAPGVKVSRIVSLTDDIALNMAAMGVRIEAPIPGKAAIGIEIANDDIDTVHLRDVLESDESLRHPSRLSVALGKDIAGKRIIADLARMPHLLIAGATGSGKSVCINTLIISIIYRATPEEVRLILIDPKKVELSVYNGIPHLLVPVVTNPKKASGALNWAVMEMDERYRLFAELGVRDIRGYNAQRPDDAPFMPQIVVIIDELSDLMLVAPGEVEESICRLAQLARACGIHLVIATQRPSVNVITGIIKANIPSRIAFAVSSQVDSRTILDTAGADKLMGKGDMLYAPSGGGKPIRVQGCFVSDEEVARVVEYVKDRHTTDYSEAVIEALSHSEEDNNAPKDEADDDAGDALFEQAVEIAVESGQASISMLQRRLRVGYARAGRLIDEMARRNIIGQAEGAKPREVLITREDLKQMFHHNQ